MECERIRASAVWKGPAAFLRPETTAALLLRDDAGGYTAAQGGQTHHYFIHYNQQQHVSAAAGSAELLEAGNPKGFGGGGGEEFLVDDLLDLGDGGVADETEAENAAGLCQGGGGLWGQGAKAGSSDSNSDLTSEAGAADAEPLLPIGNITDLEWVSQFVDDSYPYVPPCPAISPAYAVVKPEPQQRLTLQFVPNPTNGGSTSHSRSPSAGSYTSITSPVAGVCSLSLKRPWSTVSALDDPLSVAPLRKARSKRLRTDSGVRAWALRASSLLQEPLCSSASSSSSCSSTSSSFSSHFAFLEHHQPFDFGSSPAAPRPRGRPPLHKKKHPHGHAQVLAFPWQGGSEQLALLHKEKPKQKKKKGRKPKSPLFVGFSPVSSTVAAESDDAAAGAAGTGRRCSHCGVQKTPQWRAGPMGAKTLCNACGVRYKSGRLLPEYRPACSPTFVSHVHSNSHRKVLEMRRSKELMQPPQSPQQQQRQQQQQQQEQFLALSASAAAVAAAVPQAPQPPPLGAPPAMPAQQMVC